MTHHTLLARLYKFIVESRCVRITDLKGRFPEEFAEPQPAGSAGAMTGSNLGRASQRLSDALRFLIVEDLVLVNRRGRLVHVSAWKEKSQIRLERGLLGMDDGLLGMDGPFQGSREVGAN